MSDLYDIIREKGHHHEDPVPDDAWDTISRKKNKRRFVVYLPAMAALVVGLMIAGYFMVYNSAKETNPTVVDIPKKDGKNRGSDASLSETKNAEKLIAENNSVAENASVNESTKNKTGNISQDVEAERITQDQATDNIISTDAPLPVNGKEFNPNVSHKFSTGIVPEKKNNMGKNFAASDQSVKKKTTVLKDKSRSNITISNPGTEEVDEQATMLNRDLALTTKTKDAVNKEVAGDNEKAVVPEKITVPAVKPNLPELPDSIKTNSDLISDAKKALKAADKKSTRTHPWFFEAALIPVVPFQQYDEAVTFSRSLILKDGNATFSGKLVEAKLYPSVAFQLGVRTELNKKLSLKTGIQYLQLRESVSISGLQTSTLYSIAQGHVNIDDSPGIVADTSSVVLESSRNFSAVNSYSFITIPLSVQYKFLQGRSWSLGIESGLAVNIFSKYANYIDPNPKATMVSNAQNREDKTAFGLSANAGLRVGKLIAKRTELFVLPSFSYGLFEQHLKHNLVNKRISLAGIGFGISYKIR